MNTVFEWVKKLWINLNLCLADCLRWRTVCPCPEGRVARRLQEPWRVGVYGCYITIKALFVPQYRYALHQFRYNMCLRSQYCARKPQSDLFKQSLKSPPCPRGKDSRATPQVGHINTNFTSLLTKYSLIQKPCPPDTQLKMRMRVWKPWKKLKTRMKQLIQFGLYTNRAKCTAYSRKGYTNLCEAEQ